MGIERDIRRVVTKYSDMLFKICIVILCNEQDAQDAIQDTFCRYPEKRPEFQDEEHEKAWLIRVATNICRDMVRFRLRHPKVCIDELENSLAAPEHRETLRELLELPVKQKAIIYLHYVVEGRGGTLLYPQNAFGITAMSEYKEGAWEFIESVLEPGELEKWSRRRSMACIGCRADSRP